ncbi:MAG: GAF domain-containing protein, partial [Anaerolineae bacterium]|nr:GAF domain-containing protein [Anaerolineae bacterium]
MSEKKSLTEQDIKNALSTLNLLSKQIETGRVEKEYSKRQISKVRDLLERVESERHRQKSAERFEALFNVSRIMGTSLDLETVLRQVMDAVIQITRAERGFLMLQDDDGVIKVEVARNLDQQTLGSEEFAFSRSITNYVLVRGEPVLTTNA